MFPGPSFANVQRLSLFFVVKFCVLTRSSAARAKASMHKAFRALPCFSLGSFTFLTVFLAFSRVSVRCLTLPRVCASSKWFQLLLVQLEQGCRSFSPGSRRRAPAGSVGKGTGSIEDAPGARRAGTGQQVPGTRELKFNGRGAPNPLGTGYTAGTPGMSGAPAVPRCRGPQEAVDSREALGRTLGHLGRSGMA